MGTHIDFLSKLIDEDHENIDALVDADQGVREAMAEYKKQLQDVKEAMGMRVYIDLDNNVGLVALAHLNAAFRVGVGYGIRMAREIEAIAYPAAPATKGAAADV
ncbi:hypothetical protein ACFSR7_36330 [Cohnella sp. GCM10020058]|uniref:hypothetical protein n=1 Tax=Cohnella sp. GCM10020058 TaxID=3317330 RepID=UPI003626E83B